MPIYIYVSNFCRQKLKLETLEKNRLPADILETLESKPIKNKKEDTHAKPATEHQEDPAHSLNGLFLLYPSSDAVQTVDGHVHRDMFVCVCFRSVSGSVSVFVHS